MSSKRARPVVAIDGPAGAGKSTAARKLAAQLGFVLVDTGALYRGVALAADERGVLWTDAEALGMLTDGLTLDFELGSEGEPLLRVDGTPRAAEIRTPHISSGASQVSAHPQVRDALLGLQRRLAANGGVVLEGRDIGTVVVPDAEVKVFLTASPGARAERRHRELLAKGQPSELAQVLAEQLERDRRDSERPVAPLKPAADAVMLDTSGMTLDEVVARLAHIVTAKVGEKLR